MKVLIKVIISLFLFSFCFFLAPFSRAETDNNQKLQDLAKQVEEYQNKIRDLQGQQKTLASTISFLDNKIYLTQAQINKTEKEVEILKEEIGGLSVKIGYLDKSLNELSKILASRINATYKSSYFEPAYLLFSSDTFTGFFTRLKYLRTAQAHDRVLMIQLEKQKQNYDEQKDLKEKKQQEIETLKKTLEVQTATLAQQKKSKQSLLDVTKNDEKRYQQLLSVARAEQQALSVSLQCADGKLEISYEIGNLSSKGNVGTGDRIGTMGNTGAPGCSTGDHLHLEYIRDVKLEGNKLTGIPNSPINILRNQKVKFFTDTISEGDFGSGNNIWPMNNPIITQLFGQTPYSHRYSCNFHTGLDIVDLDDKTVKAVRAGKLYTGTLVCSSGSSLINTVIIDHGDGTFTTYLHLNSF